MKEMICRLCLQIIIGDNNCQPVEESLLKCLKLNKNIARENVMCIDCANCLRVFSNITSSCVYMGDGTLPLSDLSIDGIKLEPDAMETKTNPNSFMETEIKCSFCTQTHGREDLISLKESKENKFLLSMLERYILEKNLKNNEELLTCQTCLKALQGGLTVILKCLEVEEKINKYIELVGTDDKSQVELKDVQQFIFGPIIKSEIELFSVDKLEDRSDQIQEEYTMMAEAEIKYEKEIANTELIIKTEDNDITSEQINWDITDQIKSEQNDYKGFQDFSDKNKSFSKIKIFQCELCSYGAKQKSSLKTHLLTHKNPAIKMFKCELCSYEAKQKSNLKTHLLTHKSPFEIKMFKCELCSYEAKQKRYLTTHLLTHKNPSVIKMFKCELCSYEAKQKSNLITHSLTHKNPSAIKMFKCELCSYEAKQKSNLKTHLLTHKCPSVIKMFKCELCSYEAKQKSHLVSHLLTHKNPSLIKMFKCDMCSYETKQKSHLKRHLLTHKNASEIKIFI